MPRRPTRRLTKAEAQAMRRKHIADVDRFTVDKRGRLKPEGPGPSVFDLNKRKDRKKGGA